jgi:hypothetical protein
MGRTISPSHDGPVPRRAGPSLPLKHRDFVRTYKFLRLRFLDREAVFKNPTSEIASIIGNRCLPLGIEDAERQTLEMTRRVG